MLTARSRLLAAAHSGECGKIRKGKIMSWEAIERVGRSIVLQVGELIRERMGTITTANVHIKGVSDYVTDVDMKSEALIIDAVRSHFPDHRILSEETENHNRLEDGITWVIDPLDGTTNFIHGFPFVAVSVAVCEHRQPVLGFVLDPLRRELFEARRGGGAWLDGRRLGLRPVSALDECLIATGFPHRSRALVDPYLRTFKAIFQKTSGIRRAGAAALDLAYLAAGRVDGFWEAGLKAWDVAAGSLLIEEAGGAITDFWGGGCYLYNGHVLAGGAMVHPFLLEQVGSLMTPAMDAERAQKGETDPPDCREAIRK